MTLRRLALAPALAVALAGCTSSLLAPAEVAPSAVALLAQADPLWADHQNQPHPAYGWPTLTHPALGDAAPRWWAPLAAATVPTPIRGLEHVARSPEAVKAGAGMALFGSLALVPSEGPDNYVLDIADPMHPQLLGTYAAGGERGAAIMATPDGRLYGVVSTVKGFDVVNITDPRLPSLVTSVAAPGGGHKLGLVPGSPIVYVANSHGGGVGTASVPGAGNGHTPIYDLTDVEHPALVQDWKNGYGCHHIFFWVSAEKQRAICAGVEETQLWDIADPASPKIVGVVPMPLGQGVPFSLTGITPWSHTAFLNQNGDVLLVGDEFLGGNPAECTGPSPLGALWFYDVKDEKAPRLLGYVSPPPHALTNPGPTDGCTAHQGRLVPDPEGKRQLVAMAWYGNGVLLIDFTDPAHARILDAWNEGTNTWEAWYDGGYVLTGDLNRGLDVLRLR